MVNTVMSSMTMAMVAATDVTSLLQLSAGVRQSQAQHILAAVAAEGNDTICVQAVAGDVAPITGSFTAKMSQQAVVVAVGSVAEVAGSFCVAKQDVLLVQRTLGLNTARDFEAALGSKNKATTTTTTTTMDWATFDFAGDHNKEVTVEASGCSMIRQLRRNQLDPTVSAKVARETAGQKCQNGEAATWHSQCCHLHQGLRKSRWEQDGLDFGVLPAYTRVCSCCAEDLRNAVADEQRDDQVRVCECRNFLKSAVDTPNFLDELGKMQTALAAAEAAAVEDAQTDAAVAAVLLQRSFDAALASKNTANKRQPTTTTTTTLNPWRKQYLESKFGSLAKACTAASALLGSWTQVAKELNDPKYAGLFKSFHIKGGWQHCDKSWVVQGACGLSAESWVVAPIVAPAVPVA